MKGKHIMYFLLFLFHFLLIKTFSIPLRTYQCIFILCFTLVPSKKHLKNLYLLQCQKIVLFMFCFVQVMSVLA